MEQNFPAVQTMENSPVLKNKVVFLQDLPNYLAAFFIPLMH